MPARKCTVLALLCVVVVIATEDQLNQQPPLLLQQSEVFFELPSPNLRRRGARKRPFSVDHILSTERRRQPFHDGSN